MARAFTPFPLCIDHCVGAHQWDVDGNRYIDYWMGHGAMPLGQPGGWGRCEKAGYGW